MPFCTYSQSDLVHTAADVYLTKHQNVSWISGVAQDAFHGVGLPTSLIDGVPLHSACQHTLHHLMNHYHYLSVQPQKLYLPVFCLQSHLSSKPKYMSPILHHLCNYMAQTSKCFTSEKQLKITFKLWMVSFSASEHLQEKMRFLYTEAKACHLMGSRICSAT